MEDIGDPLGDRVMKNVPQIARFPLTKEELWHNSGKHSLTNKVIPRQLKLTSKKREYE